jgi:hypothetical protein
LSYKDLPPNAASLANAPLGKKSLEEGQYNALSHMYNLCQGNMNDEERMLIEDLLSHLDAKVRHFNKIRAGLFRNTVDNVKRSEQKKMPATAQRGDNEDIQRFVEKLNGVSRNDSNQISNSGSDRISVSSQNEQKSKPGPAELLEEMLKSSKGSKPVTSGQKTFEKEPAPSAPISATPTGTLSGTSMGSYTAPAVTEKKEITPEDVVRTYIEAWNTRSFNAEYKCLGGAMAMIPEKEYISRRFQTYHESNGQDVIQKLERVTENNVVGPEARLKCRKVQLEGNKTKVFLEDYVLNKDGANWRIVSVRSKQF